MSTSYTYEDNYVACICGNHFHVGLEESLREELYGDSFESMATGEKQCRCPHCKAEYSLEISVQKTIETIYRELELLNRYLYVIDLDGEDYSLGLLESMDIGDDVPLADGSYIAVDREYIVKDQEIVEFWGTTDANQISFFEENAA